MKYEIKVWLASGNLLTRVGSQQGGWPQCTVAFEEPTLGQLRLIKLVAQGLKNREIADKLGISHKVVKNYLGRIYEKIGVNGRLELALWYTARVHQQQWKRVPRQAS